MMQKKFITNLALLLFLNLLIKPFWIFGIDREVQNMIGAESYGAYYALFNFSFLFNILLDAGITNFNSRNISQNKQLFTKHFSGIIMLRLLLGVGYVVFSMAAGYAIGYTQEQFTILWLLLFNQFLLSAILYLRSNISGLGYYKYDSLMSVADRFLMIIFCAVLMWTSFTGISFSITAFILAQTAAYVLTVIIALFILFKKEGLVKPVWNPNFYWVILRQSAPYALLILLMTFYNRVDSIMIERLLPDGAFHAGVYAQGFRILDAANMFAFLFATLLLPMFSHMLKAKENISDLLQLSFLLLIIPAFVLGVCCYVFQFELMNILYHANTELSAPVFGVLMMSFTAISTTYIFGTLLTANGKLKQLNLMAFSAMILNITLNLILIKKMQSLGAAYAGIITQVITAIIQVYLAVKVFGLKINYSFLLRLLTVFLIIIASGYLVYQTEIKLFAGSVIIICSAVIVSFFLKIFDIPKILSLLRGQ